MGTVQKVLLYGGTFDPPHNGHMNNLRAALELVRPDKAIVMPAGIPPHKKASTTPGKVRLAMCQCFTALSPAVEVSDWEIAQGGRSYTVHTLEMLRDAYPGAELYLCVGSDMLLTFTQWYRWQDMLAMAALVVESREAGDEPALQAAAADLTAQGGRVLFARAEAYPCASSDIRSGKIPPEQWPEVLPPETLRVVQENHLYSAEKEVRYHDLRRSQEDREAASERKTLDTHQKCKKNGGKTGKTVGCRPGKSRCGGNFA